MTTLTETPAGEPTIVMTRVYDAPRNLVWQAITDAKHVRSGGAVQVSLTRSVRWTSAPAASGAM